MLPMGRGEIRGGDGAGRMEGSQARRSAAPPSGMRTQRAAQTPEPSQREQRVTDRSRVAEQVLRDYKTRVVETSRRRESVSGRLHLSRSQAGPDHHQS